MKQYVMMVWVDGGASNDKYHYHYWVYSTEEEAHSKLEGYKIWDEKRKLDCPTLRPCVGRVIEFDIPQEISE